MRRYIMRTDGVAVGEVVATTLIRQPWGEVIVCPAALLVAATAARAGVRVRPGRAAAKLDGDAVLLISSYVASDGSLVGLGAAANAADEAAVAVARQAVDAWSETIRQRRVLRAGPGPLCRGARRAQAMTGNALSSGPVYVYGDLMGPPNQGITRVRDIHEVPDGASIVFPAHGVPLAVRAEAAARGLRIIDATCPLVEAAQESVLSFAGAGDTVVVIGRSGHTVVDGLIGQAPEQVVLAESKTDLPKKKRTGRLSYVLQPGVPVEDLMPLSAALRRRYPVRAMPPDAICYAASDRAAAVRAVAAESDVLFVIGTADSVESAYLTRLASATEVHIINRPAQIRPQWVAPAATIGMVETSTARPEVALKVITALSGLGQLGVAERRQITEITTSTAYLRH